jgi:hypothetical protein
MAKSNKKPSGSGKKRAGSGKKKPAKKPVKKGAKKGGKKASDYASRPHPTDLSGRPAIGSCTNPRGTRDFHPGESW